MATIERYIVNVGWAYRMPGITDPTAAPLVKLEMQAARKSLGVRQRQARALLFKGDITDLVSPPSGVCLVPLMKDRKSVGTGKLVSIRLDPRCLCSQTIQILYIHTQFLHHNC